MFYIVVFFYCYARIYLAILKLEGIRLETELASKIFMLEDYGSRENMEEHIKEYIKKLKDDFPFSVVTREFYKGDGVLVRATQINFNINIKRHDLEKEELEKEEARIKERVINGLGENVYREKNNSKSREKESGHKGGNERERGGR